MPLLNEKIIEQLKKEMEVLKDVVTVIFFKESSEKCNYCKETEVLLKEVSSVSNKIKIVVNDIDLQKDEAMKYGIDKTPAIVLLDSSKKDLGIRFYGVPGGHEFSSFVEAIKMVSTGESGLLPETKEELKKITKPVDIKVFVTLTCPYCPAAVKLANKFAFESERITTQMIDASEFMDLAEKYDVHTVPKVVINEKETFEGARKEAEFLGIIKKLS